MKSTLLIPLAAIVAISAVTGCSRKEDFTVNSSVKSSGIELHRFRSKMAPAIPDQIQIAADFQDLFGKAGVDVPGASADVAKTGRDAYGWEEIDGTKVTVFTKSCSDNSECLDRVVVTPPPRKRLQNMASKKSNALYVEASSFQDWPFTIEYGVLRCRKAQALTIENEDHVWYLNGMGKTWVPGSLDMAGIQKRDPETFAYQYSSSLDRKARGLCK